MMVCGLLLAASAGCRKDDSPPGEDVLVTVEEFRTGVLEADRPVLVDFFATWCAPCKVLSPRIEALSREYQGRSLFYKVDVDRSGDLARRYEITAVPTVLVFVEGREVRRWRGLKDTSEYRAVLDAHLRGET